MRVCGLDEPRRGPVRYPRRAQRRYRILLESRFLKEIGAREFRTETRDLHLVEHPFVDDVAIVARDREARIIVRRGERQRRRADEGPFASVDGCIAVHLIAAAYEPQPRGQWHEPTGDEGGVAAVGSTRH